MIPLLFLFGRYLLDLLENVSKGLHARLHLKQMSAVTQNRLTELHLRSIQDLKLKCEKVSSILNSPMILIILKMMSIELKFNYFFYISKNCEKYASSIKKKNNVHIGISKHLKQDFQTDASKSNSSCNLW